MTSPENLNSEQVDIPTLKVPLKWAGINIDQPEGGVPCIEVPMTPASDIPDFPSQDNYEPDPFGPEANSDYYDPI